eukprot:1143202-Pelagomonas_calceolata.AAC.3
MQRAKLMGLPVTCTAETLLLYALDAKRHKHHQRVIPPCRAPHHDACAEAARIEQLERVIHEFLRGTNQTRNK